MFIADRSKRFVIFDCDGVLVDSEAISNGVLARMLTREGLAMTLHEARRDYQGMLLSDICRQAEAKLASRCHLTGFVEYERERVTAFRRGLEPVAGAAEAVRRVKAAGLKVCVASQGALEMTRMTLGLTGLRDLFASDALFSAHDVPRPKPDPALFRHAAAKMGARPSRCVVVEGTVSGVAAAVAAGMRAVGYAADSDRNALSNAGAELLRTLTQIPEMLAI
jgi:HAD superfamily hydrolase (TIGR01509 family)